MTEDSDKTAVYNVLSALCLESPPSCQVSDVYLSHFDLRKDFKESMAHSGTPLKEKCLSLEISHKKELAGMNIERQAIRRKVRLKRKNQLFVFIELTNLRPLAVFLETVRPFRKTKRKKFLNVLVKKKMLRDPHDKQDCKLKTRQPPSRKT